MGRVERVDWVRLRSKYAAPAASTSKLIPNTGRTAIHANAIDVSVMIVPSKTEMKKVIEPTSHPRGGMMPASILSGLAISARPTQQSSHPTARRIQACTVFSSRRESNISSVLTLPIIKCSMDSPLLVLNGTSCWFSFFASTLTVCGSTMLK